MNYDNGEAVFGAAISLSDLEHACSGKEASQVERFRAISKQLKWFCVLYKFAIIYIFFLTMVEKKPRQKYHRIQGNLISIDKYRWSNVFESGKDCSRKRARSAESG